MALTIELRPGLEFETGCIFDGANGRYNPPRLIDLAANVSSGENIAGLSSDGGYVLDNDGKRALAMYNDHEAGIVANGMTAGEWIDELANDAETYLNSLIPAEPTLPENVSGVTFGWLDGDFMFYAYDESGEIIDV